MRYTSGVKRKIRLIVAACGVAIISYALTTTRTQHNALAPVQANQPGLYAIDHFIDGDTIAVKMSGKSESVRLIGVDTPETHKPHTPVQCYGPAAAAFTKNLIGSGSVRLQADPDSTNRDRYNRLLRYVYLPDGRLLEAQLIQNGYGFAYTQFPFTKSAEFVEYQQAAQQNHRGLWGNCAPFQEQNGRWQTENAS